MSTDREPGTVTWRDLHTETMATIAALPFDTAPAEARWIVEQAGGDRLEAIGDQPATARGVANLDAMVARREAGEPVQYVLGHWPFRTLDLFVDRRVLIPRPETEVVAGLVVAAVEARPRGARLADLGTGSGAIALSVAAECRDTEIWATDASADALDVARANLAGLGRRAAAVTLCLGSWFEALPHELRHSLDVIVSNPPYVSDSDPLPAAVEAWEPAAALRAGPDGLDDLRTVIGGAGEWLADEGVLVCEIDPRQAEAVTRIAARHGFTSVEVHPDLAGRARALVARRD